MQYVIYMLTLCMPIFSSRTILKQKKRILFQNSNKITMLLEMVADYNKKGGALFLFCDNFPFVLEANLLLTEYLNFESIIHGFLFCWVTHQIYRYLD